jgi:hypothetical protein
MTFKRLNGLEPYCRLGSLEIPNYPGNCGPDKLIGGVFSDRRLPRRPKDSGCSFQTGGSFRRRLAKWSEGSARCA